MNPERPVEHVEEILACLDGEMSAEVRAAFEARLHSDAGLNREYEAFRELYADLEAIGRLVEEPCGEALRNSERRPAASPAVGPDELLGYVTQELDEVAQRRVKRQLDKDPGANREAAVLGEMREILQEAGQAVAEAAPEADLVDGVLGKVAELRAAARMESSFPAATEALFEAYLDDALDQSVLEEMGTADLRVGEAYAGWKQLKNDLESIGEAVKHTAPKVNLTPGVVERVHSANVVSPLRTRSKPSGLAPMLSRPLLRYAALAAAAGIIFALGLWMRVWRVTPGATETQWARQIPESAVTAYNDTPAVGFPGSIPGDGEPQTASIPAEPKPSAGSVGPALERVSMREALDTYRNALQGDIKAAQRLARWSLMGAEKARAIVQRPDAPVDAKIGACQFLPPAEAQPVLTSIIQRDRKDFHARLLLAEKDAESGGYDAAKQERLESWGAADPGNALPLYLEGRALLERDLQGNRSAAFDALDRAEERPSATAYALEHANRQEQALRGGGLEENTAVFLAAATLGNDAYTTVTGLGKDLIGQGTRLESEGDYPAAERIYQAVLQMGTQVSTSAMAAQERLAGLDVRKSACAALESLYLANGDPVQAQTIRNESAQVAGEMEELARQLEAYNALFAAADEQRAAEVARATLEHGDTAVLDELL